MSDATIGSVPSVADGIALTALRRYFSMIIPVLDVGLSPVLQWVVIPQAAFWWASRPFRVEGKA
tara:strand:+ start:1452 stop:1643 length:192 start_codon:yes stop_codon:yes gene_type:complete